MLWKIKQRNLFFIKQKDDPKHKVSCINAGFEKSLYPRGVMQIVYLNTSINDRFHASYQRNLNLMLLGLSKKKLAYPCQSFKNVLLLLKNQIPTWLYFWIVEQHRLNYIRNLEHTSSSRETIENNLTFQIITPNDLKKIVIFFDLRLSYEQTFKVKSNVHRTSKGTIFIKLEVQFMGQGRSNKSRMIPKCPICSYHP